MTRLKEERNKLKLTQNQVATANHISESMYYQLESGRKKPSFETMEKLSRFFHKSVDYLFFESSITQSDKEEMSK